MSEHTIKVTLSDSLWSYCAQLISIGSGIISLPLILVKLTTSEIAIYYIIFYFLLYSYFLTLVFLHNLAEISVMFLVEQKY